LIVEQAKQIEQLRLEMDSLRLKLMDKKGKIAILKMQCEMYSQMAANGRDSGKQ
jgi:hypothetical protein